MYLGEVCILTGDVPRLAAWYRALLGIRGENADDMHQTVIGTEPMLTIMRAEDDGCGRNMCIAFTVADMAQAFAHVQAIGAEVLEPPVKRPWGAVNMILRDPDGNRVYLRQLP